MGWLAWPAATARRPAPALRRPLALAAIAALGLLMVWQTYEAARARAVAASLAAGQQRLGLYASTIRNAIDRYSYLPSLLAMDKDVTAALAGGDAASLRVLNEKLEKVVAASGTAALFVMKADGMTVASSNWRDRDSFVGHSYHFRPYYQQAVAQDTGRYYGVGVTTSRPGYFMARSVRAGGDGRIIGVVVVKIELDPLQREWAAGGETVLLTDDSQVVILASDEHWKYEVLATLDPTAKARLDAAQQYAYQTLRPVHLRQWATLDGDARLVDFGRPDRRYVMLSAAMPPDGWTIHYLTDWHSITAEARRMALLAAFVWVMAVLLGLYLRQRRISARARREADEAVAAALRQARDELERTVEQRTAALRDAQEELVHAGKMAALGQMSAAIAHELNQPLAAIRTFLASTRLLLERGDAETVGRNLGMIDQLTGRMAQIVKHLKVFARKSPGQRHPVDLSVAVERALELLDGPLRAAGVAVERRLLPGAVVEGDQLRLEQVLVNLLQNAIDAMRGSDRRSLAVAVERQDNAYVVTLQDSGPGIPAQVLPQLFDPFFTTKEVGDGLGLGLSISYGIVRDLGGSIRAANAPEGGAVFALELPAAATQQETANHG